MSKRGENIYHRKDGLWEARYVKGLDGYGKKKYGSVYGHTYREAKEKRLDVISQISLYPQSLSVRKITLNAIAREWLYINQKRLKPSTYQKYIGFLENHIEKQIGDYPIIYLTPIIFKQYTDKQEEKGLSAVTINGILTFISSCLKYAQRQYRIPKVDIIYLKQPLKEMRVLSLEEQRILTTFLLRDTDVYKLGVLIALYSGIRVGELCALKWSDIRDNAIKVSKTMQRLSKGVGQGTEIIIGEPKTPTSNRVVPLPTAVVPVIERFRGPDEAYVLCTQGHKFTEPRVMQYHFQRYLKELDMPKAGFHALRHSFASSSAALGVDVKVLSDILGHRDVKTSLNKYIHSSLALKTEQMQVLNSLW